MQWSCPHCGVTLAVPYDTLGTGWSFSRCYKCGGFALIRRAEVNIIKVDKAPPGEKVILPEAGTDPTAGLLNEEAAQQLAKHTNRMKADKPTIRPARQVSPPPIPKTLQKFDSMEGLNIDGPAFENTEPLNQTITDLPKRRVPSGIIVAALLAVSSGIYLYFQGQSAYQKVKESAFESHKPSTQHISSNSSDSPLVSRVPETATPPNNPNIAAAAGPNLSITKEANTVAQADNPPAFKVNKIVAEQKITRPLITDQVQESAMAPLKPITSSLSGPNTTFLVQTRLKRVSLHEGPGMQFPVTGIANPDIRYVVADWKDRWFKIALNNRGALNNVGWIRNDLVQVMPSTLLGNTVPDINPLRQ